MQELLDLPTTPEDLYPIIQDFTNQFTKKNILYFYDNLWVEVVPEKKRKVILLEDGSKTEIEIEISPARPENLVINFCDRQIISIQGKQTNHDPSNYHGVMNLLVTENDYEINRYIDINGKEVFSLDGYDQAKFIMNNLIGWIGGYFPKKQELMTKSAGHSVRKKNPPGRPRKKGYDSIYEYMQKNKCSIEIAYSRWQDQFPEEVSMSSLVDNEKRFKKAMNYRIDNPKT